MSAKQTSAYIIYCKENRETFKQSNPDYSPQQIKKELSTSWKNLNAEEKNLYKNKVLERKEAMPQAQAQPKKTKKVAKDDGRVKRPKTGYMFYCSEHRDEVKQAHPDAKMTDLTKILASQWKDLSTAEKKPYQDMAAKDKKRYEEEKEANPQQQVKTEKKSKKNPDRPKRKLTGYIYFCQQSRPSVKEDNPDMSPKQLTSELGRLWNQLDDSTKKSWNEKAAST
jgi:hypothetical protein